METLAVGQGIAIRWDKGSVFSVYDHGKEIEAFVYGKPGSSSYAPTEAQARQFAEQLLDQFLEDW